MLDKLPGPNLEKVGAVVLASLPEIARQGRLSETEIASWTPFPIAASPLGQDRVECRTALDRELVSP